MGRVIVTNGDLLSQRRGPLPKLLWADLLKIQICFSISNCDYCRNVSSSHVRIRSMVWGLGRGLGTRAVPLSRKCFHVLSLFYVLSHWRRGLDTDSTPFWCILGAYVNASVRRVKVKTELKSSFVCQLYKKEREGVPVRLEHCVGECSLAHSLGGCHDNAPF